MRSWLLPLRFNEEGSRDAGKERKISFPLAVVSDEDVWLFVDFARLITFHVISQDRPWTFQDLTPGSEVRTNCRLIL